VTLISSISVEGMGASMSIEGSSDTDSFGRYIRASRRQKPIAPASNQKELIAST
jgi:hypothetical protein